METFLKDKKISISVFILLVVVSLFTIIKIVNEVKSSSYIGRGDQPVNMISINGEGEVLAVSDIASIVINLSKEANTAKESQTLLNESLVKTLSYLKEQQIEDKDIKSEYGGLNPKYSYEKCYVYPCPSEQKIVGYTATQSITVKIREVDSANTIKTGLAEIGITDISGPTFSIDNEDNFKDQARSQAINDAKAKAEILAKELGVKLGKVVSFYENNGNGYQRYELKSAMTSSVAMDSVAAPTLPKGENKITSNVTITYEIK